MLRKRWTLASDAPPWFRAAWAAEAREVPLQAERRPTMTKPKPGARARRLPEPTVTVTILNPENRDDLPQVLGELLGMMYPEVSVRCGIIERTELPEAGTTEASAAGDQVDRPRLTPEQIDSIREMREAGESWESIAERLGLTADEGK